MTGPLTGFRVLDFSWVIAGPCCTRILLDLGAEVIKVEQPGRGDFFRRGDTTGADVPFGYWNYGKESISVNLKDPRGVALCRDLAAKSDVVVENFRPGTLERLGLGAQALKEINPRLVYCSISGFGASSSMAQRPLQAAIAHALSGVMTMVGEPGDPPFQPAASLADVNAGIHAALSILAALLGRERTGHAATIDISLLDALVWLIGPMAEHSSLGRPIGWDKRLGAQNRGTVPAGSFKGRDGWLMLAGGIDDVAWQRLSTAIGLPELADRPHSWRFANQDEVYRILSEWVAAQPSVQEAEDYLLKFDVLCSRVNSPMETVEMPYLHERGMIEPVEHPIHGHMMVTNSPFRFDDEPSHWTGPAPGLGEHNAQVLGRVLGLDAATIEQLETDKVLYSGAAKT